MNVDAILCVVSSARGQSLYKDILCFQEEAISIFNTGSKVTGMVFKNSAELEVIW